MYSVISATGGKRINPRPEAWDIYTMSNTKISNAKTDWGKCCICQTDKLGKVLKQLIPSHGRPDQDGYLMFATNIPPFQELNQLPMIIDPARLDEGGSIEVTLRQNTAQYHQSCRLRSKTPNLNKPRKGHLKLRNSLKKAVQRLEESVWKLSNVSSVTKSFVMMGKDVKS